MVIEAFLAFGSVWLFLWTYVLVHEFAHYYFIRKYNIPCFYISVGGMSLRLKVNKFVMYFGLSPTNGGCSIAGDVERSKSEWRNVFVSGPIAGILYGLGFVVLCSLFANSVFPYIIASYILLLLSLFESRNYKGQDLNTLKILSKTQETRLTFTKLLT